MSEKQKELNEGGFHLNTDRIDCLPCKCRKKTVDKETKINNEGKTIISPDENHIFKTNSQDNESIDTVTTGWGSRKPTPEERLEKVDEDVERIDKHVTILKKKLHMLD